MAKKSLPFPKRLFLERVDELRLLMLQIDYDTKQDMEALHERQIRYMLMMESIKKGWPAAQFARSSAESAISMYFLRETRALRAYGVAR